VTSPKTAKLALLKEMGMKGGIEYLLEAGTIRTIPSSVVQKLRKRDTST
jgi:hypothetical protein